MLRRLFLALSLGACATGGGDFAGVSPAFETEAVRSRGDAADDPAIWINQANPAQSLILGTDKQAGLHVYDLSGREKQFLPLPAPNNVDIQHEVFLGGLFGDFAVTSNRRDQTFSVLKVTAEGVQEISRLPAETPQPYGICIGANPAPLVAITHKTGEVDVYALSYDGAFKAKRIGLAYKPGVEMEGCVFDEAHNALYVGYEQGGVVRFSLDHLDQDLAPKIIDQVDGETGLVADIEGLTLYETGPLSGYLLASSQGDNSFAAYDRITGAYKGRFRIVRGPGGDGARETDGIDATSTALGARFPKGILVVQDGFNAGDGGRQNFKIVDWREVQPLLAPPE